MASDRHHALARGCGIYGLGVMEDEEAAAIGAEGEKDGEEDETGEEDASRCGGEFLALAIGVERKRDGDGGGDEHEQFVLEEHGLDFLGGLNGILRDEAGGNGGEGGEGAEIKQANGGAMPFVVGSPERGGFEGERAEPEGDWEMNEKRMEVEKSLHSWKH